MLTEPLLDPGPDEPRSVTDERGALPRGRAIMTVDTLCRLRGMIDEDKVEHRLRYTPDIAALLESRPDDDPVLVEFVQTMNELYRLGMACEEVEPSATDAELAAITATHQRHLDQALRLHVCPPELRARIPELVAEGERIIPAVREWSSQAKALFWEIEQAQYAPHIPPNVRMSGFETGGYRALENVLMYLAGVVYEAWDQGDSGDMPDIDGVAGRALRHVGRRDRHRSCLVRGATPAGARRRARTFERSARERTRRGSARSSTCPTICSPRPRLNVPSPPRTSRDVSSRGPPTQMCRAQSRGSRTCRRVLNEL